MSLYHKDDTAIPELDASEEESNFNFKSLPSASAKSQTEENSHIGSGTEKKFNIVVYDTVIDDGGLNSPNSMDGFERQRQMSNY